jgi:hypothetical protein
MPEDKILYRIIAVILLIITIALMTMAVRSCESYNKIQEEYAKQGLVQIPAQTWVKPPNQ